jgi:spermidine synthase
VEPGKNGDIIYGGGALDGSFSIDPIANEMGIQRAYMLAALHSNPEEVLEIGAASGSWTRVMAAHSGYLDLIKKYQDFGTLLSNPKIRYYLDDGRRWLKRNPEARFDVIVMMTIYHWRSSATNLLSKEFLEMCRDHLKEGGVVYLHPTMSQDVAFTAANVFRYVTQYGGLVAASDRPFEIGSEERRRNLLMFQEGNRVILDGGDTAMRTVLDQMVGFAGVRICL